MKESSKRLLTNIDNENSAKLLTIGHLYIFYIQYNRWNPVQPTVEPLELSRVECSDWIRHARCFADSVGVDGSDSEVVGVSFKQSGHGVFTDLYGVIVALSPVFCSDLTSNNKDDKGRGGKLRMHGGR